MAPMPPYARKFFRWPIAAGILALILLIAAILMPDRTWAFWSFVAIIVLSPVLIALPWYIAGCLQEKLEAVEGQLCPGCGHDLRGTPPGHCPECGRAFDSAELRETWRHLRSGHHAAPCCTRSDRAAPATGETTTTPPAS